MSGDLLFHVLAKKVIGVETKGRSGTVRHSITTHVMIDPARYLAVIADFVESATTGWHTLDPLRLPLKLARHRCFAIALSSLGREASKETDAALRNLPEYLGAMAVDPGNALQMRMFTGLLIYNEFYRERSLYVVEPFDEEAWDIRTAGWWTSVPFDTVEWWEPGHRVSEPPVFPHTEPSERGQVSLRLLEALEATTHSEDVLRSFASGSRMAAGEVPVVVTHTPEAAIDPDRMERKLTEYCLNPDHPTGRAKALVFRAALGIDRSNWRFLATQFAHGLDGLPLQRLRSVGYGIQYHVDLPIAGKAGRAAWVRTAWKFDAGGYIELVSAYVMSSKEAKGLGPPNPRSRVVPEGDWPALYAAAHDAGLEASATLVPRPMFVSANRGDDSAWIVAEGEFGSASVNIRDARRGFANWLRRNGIGHPGFPRGWEVFAPDHFVQRGRAYAEAFAAILQLNGVDCSFDSRLD